MGRFLPTTSVPDSLAPCALTVTPESMRTLWLEEFYDPFREKYGFFLICIYCCIRLKFNQSPTPIAQGIDDRNYTTNNLTVKQDRWVVVVEQFSEEGSLEIYLH